MALLNSTLCAPSSAAKTEYATGSSRCHIRGTYPAALRYEHRADLRRLVNTFQETSLGFLCKACKEIIINPNHNIAENSAQI